MAKMTRKQKIFFIAAIAGGKGGNVPGGNPDIVPEFTYIKSESGAVLTNETGIALLVTENSQT